jgi:hypothetical protein
MVQKAKISEIVNKHMLKLLFFILAFGYFFRFGNYILFFQENQSLFIYSEPYIRGFLSKPGGILVLAGKFLTQFYTSEWVSAFLLALTLTTLAYLFSKLLRLLNLKSPLEPLLSLIPAGCLGLMQSHYYHFMEVNLGYLSVLLFLLLSVSLNKKNLGYITLLLFPFFYYIAGAFAWIFAGSYLAYLLIFATGKQRYLYPLLLILTSVLVIFISAKWLFLQPENLLISFPLHTINDLKYHYISYGLTGFFIVIYPLGKFTFRSKIFKQLIINIFSIVFLFSLGVSLYMSNNVQTSRVLQTEKYIFDQKWDEAIRFCEKKPSGNLIGQYFYNVALSESDELCDKLFAINQNFGVGSLILPWGNEHLSFGAYFYYSVGLVNEAQRWAYEDMVVNGQKPSNMKMLVKTNLINGNYRMAQKYIDILKKTRNYKKWALEYEKLADDTALIKSNAELNRQRQNMPKTDFFIQVGSPQNNIPLLIGSNPGNKRAFEYKMAWLMLSKDIEGIVSQVKILKTLGYTRIPRHLEEAVMIYYNVKGSLPDLGGLPISNETRSRFDQYVAAFKATRQNKDQAKQTLGALFGNTFMYYYHFS